MKIFKANWKEKLFEFPYELEHFCIVCAKDKEQAKDVILDSNPEIRGLKVREIHTDLPCIIFHHFTEVE